MNVIVQLREVISTGDLDGDSALEYERWVRLKTLLTDSIPRGIAGGGSVEFIIDADTDFTKVSRLLEELQETERYYQSEQCITDLLDAAREYREMKRCGVFQD